MKSLDLIYDASELRKLIIEKPDFPLVIFAGRNTYCEDYSWIACTDVRVSIGEVLDCEQSVKEDYIYCDRKEFEDDLWNYLEDEFEGDDEEFFEFIKNKLKEYEPYWKSAIIIYADNQEEKE